MGLPQKSLCFLAKAGKTPSIMFPPSVFNRNIATALYLLFRYLFLRE